MAYVTKQQVAEDAKVSGGFTATTLPSATRVEEIIAEEEAKINAQLGRKYNLPLVGATSLLIARGISAALCVERVRDIMEVSGLGSEKDQKPTGASAASRARKLLDEIEAGTVPLSEEVEISSTDGVRSYAVENDEEPIFKKGCDQW